MTDLDELYRAHRAITAALAVTPDRVTSPLGTALDELDAAIVDAHRAAKPAAEAYGGHNLPSRAEAAAERAAPGWTETYTQTPQSRGQQVVPRSPYERPAEEGQ